MAKRSKTDDVVIALGESGLVGWPGRVARTVAGPVSRRTRWNEEQVRTAIGLLLLVYAVYRLARPTTRVIRRMR
jgi:hypothetical protein